MDRYWEMEVFAATVELKSFSAVARRMDLSPSAVSKLIQRLEDRLGVRLIYRSSRMLRLTHEGEIFYKAACRIMDEMIDAENSLGVGPKEARGTLRIHSLLSFAKYKLAPLMPRFLEEHPHLRVEFYLGTSVNVVASGIDIAIQSGEVKDQNLIAKRIGASRWLLCASPGYLDKHGKPRTIEDLGSHNCLNFTFSSPWNTWPFHQDGRQVFFQARGTAAADQGEMLLALGRAGVGIVRHAEFHVAQDIREGRLVPVLTEFHDGTEEPLYALYQNRTNMSPRVQAFLTFLEASLSPR